MSRSGTNPEVRILTTFMASGAPGQTARDNGKPNGGIHVGASKLDTAVGMDLEIRRSGSMQVAWLDEILETVREFGAASLGLVAWELSLEEEELAPAWAYAIQSGLLWPVGAGMHATASDAAETPYTLATERLRSAQSPTPEGSH
jgi:hypothetical protein